MRNKCVMWRTHTPTFFFFSFFNYVIYEQKSINIVKKKIDVILNNKLMILINKSYTNKNERKRHSILLLMDLTYIYESNGGPLAVMYFERFSFSFRQPQRNQINPNGVCVCVLWSGPMPNRAEHRHTANSSPYIDGDTQRTMTQTIQGILRSFIGQRDYMQPQCKTVFLKITRFIHSAN